MIRDIFNKLKSIDKKYIFIIILAFILIISFIVYKIVFNEKIQYTIQNGFIEKVSENQAITVLNENIVQTDSSLTIVPVIEEGKRVSKGERISIYKNAEYEEYLKKINQMDSQIETLIKDLPSTYSSDVASIEQEILKLAKESLNTTSYVKMQEYKKNIDELSKKKVTLLSELSPQGSKIRELIKEREEYESKSNKSGSNIFANSGGIVSYKIDTLENNEYINNISDINIDNIENLYLQYSQNNVNKFGIKIVDNYKAYLIVREPKGENDKYIYEGKKYTLRLIEQNYKEFSGKLIKYLENENSNYVVFEITNNVEDIYNTRFIGVEIVWKRTENLLIPLNALRYNQEKNYYYVNALKYGNYVDIPVKLLLSNDNTAIIDNFDDEELQSLEIEKTYDIKLYDRIVLE